MRCGQHALAPPSTNIGTASVGGAAGSLAHRFEDRAVAELVLCAREATPALRETTGSHRNSLVPIARTQCLRYSYASTSARTTLPSRPRNPATHAHPSGTLRISSGARQTRSDTRLCACRHVRNVPHARVRPTARPHRALQQRIVDRHSGSHGRHRGRARNFAQTVSSLALPESALAVRLTGCRRRRYQIARRRPAATRPRTMSSRRRARWRSR